jgi:hypothetical protein
MTAPTFRWQVPLRSEASHSFWADRSSQGWQSGLSACIAANFVFVHAICPWLLEAASPTATSIFLPLALRYYSANKKSYYSANKKNCSGRARKIRDLGPSLQMKGTEHGPRV